MQEPNINDVSYVGREYAISTDRYPYRRHSSMRRLLRDVDLAELPHLLLAFFLLLEKFALTRDVAAVAVRGDVLAQRAEGMVAYPANYSDRKSFQILTACHVGMD
ncbi:hypothetical protein [Bradyrhizobium sp. 930_D9_N1_4]|uniref:hypothetical protein n=1 Tax=Bradyrhizobium sp. 930_D9_N1_4 TaxID=3240374 RepID=UPI003F8C8909